jgi:hypothetical protein
VAEIGGGQLLTVNAQPAFGDDVAFLRRFCRTQIYSEFFGESPEDEIEIGVADGAEESEMGGSGAEDADMARMSRELSSLRHSLLVTPVPGVQLAALPALPIAVSAAQ